MRRLKRQSGISRSPNYGCPGLIHEDFVRQRLWLEVTRPISSQWSNSMAIHRDVIVGGFMFRWDHRGMCRLFLHVGVSCEHPGRRRAYGDYRVKRVPGRGHRVTRKAQTLCEDSLSFHCSCQIVCPHQQKGDARMNGLSVAKSLEVCADAALEVDCVKSCTDSMEVKVVHVATQRCPSLQSGGRLTATCPLWRRSRWPTLQWR